LRTIRGLLAYDSPRVPIAEPRDRAAAENRRAPHVPRIEDMVDFWGVALGGGIAIVGSIAVKWWEEYRHRRALRAAFCAEINGILEIAKARGHLRNAEEWLARWRRGEDHVPQLFTLDDDKMPEDPVYDKNVDKIGMLGTDAADIVLFYTNLNAVRISLRVFMTGQVKEFTIERKIAWVENALAIWRPSEALGRSLVRRLMGTPPPARSLVLQVAPEGGRAPRPR
jgi:hypothetical protein